MPGEILAKVREKRGGVNEDFAGAVQALQAQQAQSTALDQAGKVGLLSLGGGAALRGAQELFNLYKRNIAPPRTKSGPAFLPLPYPVDPNEAEEKKRLRQHVKIANLEFLKDFGKGNFASTPSGVPWAMPLTMGLGLAGVYGGYKGSDILLNKLHEEQKKKELEKSRQEFHDAAPLSVRQPAQPAHAQDGW